MDFLGVAAVVVPLAVSGAVQVVEHPRMLAPLQGIGVAVFRPVRSLRVPLLARERFGEVEVVIDDSVDAAHDVGLFGALERGFVRRMGIRILHPDFAVIPPAEGLIRLSGTVNRRT